MSTSDSFKILQPAGTLTGVVVQELLKQFAQCVEAKTKIVLLDLKNVDFIDSSGLGSLVSMHTKLRLAGGKLYLCSLQEQARCLFDITDMDRVFEIFANPAEFRAIVIQKNQAVLVQE